MINRELIRTKVVQLTYAYYQNGNKNMENAEKELLFSLSKAYDLYNYLLLLIVEISREERRRFDILTARAEREGTDKPSNKFAFNKFAIQLEENKMLNAFLEDKKLTWENDKEFIRGKCNQIEQSEVYKEYMDSNDDSYEADREVWRKLYKMLIQDNAELDAILEEKSLYWNDDKEIVDTFVLKTIKRTQAVPRYHSQCRYLSALYERGQSQLGFLASGVHGCGHHADSHSRDDDFPQHPHQRYHQRICGFGKALQYTQER